MPNPDSPNRKAPTALGFHMPAEWEPHSAVWLSWPYDTTSFPFLEKAEVAFTYFIKEIHDSEKVELQIVDEQMQERASSFFKAADINPSRVSFHRAVYAD